MELIGREKKVGWLIAFFLLTTKVVISKGFYVLWLQYGHVLTGIGLLKRFRTRPRVKGTVGLLLETKVVRRLGAQLSLHLRPRPQIPSIHLLISTSSLKDFVDLPPYPEHYGPQWNMPPPVLYYRSAKPSSR